jgi:hypothetical protein
MKVAADTFDEAVDPLLAATALSRLSRGSLAALSRV